MSGADDDDIVEEDDTPFLEGSVQDVAGSGLGLGGLPVAAPAPSASASAAPAPTSLQAPQPPQRQVSLEELKRWTILYPAYFDPRLSVAQGRRLPRSKCAGCEDASVQDVGEACHRLGFSVAMVPKRYPRSDFTRPGRAHVELFCAPGTPAALAAIAVGGPGARAPTHPTVPTKLRLIELVAQTIPKCPGRRQRQEYIDRMTKEHAARVAQASNPRAGKMSKAEIKDARKRNLAAAAAAANLALTNGSGSGR